MQHWFYFDKIAVTESLFHWELWCWEINNYIVHQCSRIK